MLRFDRAYSPQKEVREKCIEATRFARVPGGQWEGATAAGTKLDEQFEKYPKFEINKVATELNRIIAEYRNNRITVKFRPGDREASEELANKLNGLFRADYEETDGGEACDNAFDDAATGGFGCFRFREECRIRAWRQQETWVPVVLTPLQKRRCIFRGCRRLTIQARRLCSSRFVRFRNTPTITTNNITLMLVNLSGSNLNLHRYHSQQPAVTFLHYGVING